MSKFKMVTVGPVWLSAKMDLHTFGVGIRFQILPGLTTGHVAFIVGPFELRVWVT